MEIPAVTDMAEVFAWSLRTDQTVACRPRGGILTLVSPWSQRQGFVIRLIYKVFARFHFGSQNSAQMSFNAYGCVPGNTSSSGANPALGCLPVHLPGPLCAVGRARERQP